MARTSPKYGCAPKDRSLEEILHNGIIVLDKPRGPTSHEVVSWAKKVLGLDKAGHSGTLDPKVTGVLPVALDNGTRIVKNLLDTGKEYVCLMRLHDDVGQEAIISAMDSFQGQIFQRPPVKSAVKRQVRKRRIYSLEILDMMDRFVLFRVECEAGTYIRKLVYDIGMVLGCGANMAELRRTKAGSFTESDLITLQELSDAFHYYTEGDCVPLSKMIHPIERAVDHLPKVYLRDSAIDAICHGADVAAPGVVRLDGNVRKKRKVAIFSLKGELVALGQSMADAEDFKKMKSGFMINTQRVVMKENTYPKYWKSSS
ncbi:MAG: RNA-guided pseudouridylation complex pseudouridine synthase subunit Cbf5 [Candidatus Methanofastidiosa archaeon]|nr:RNA-guided pseudouridylation complex pseudouridine synthase subunit Cbf5 [Candidatus Methanofastidiosa archaeon]